MKTTTKKRVTQRKTTVPVPSVPPKDVDATSTEVRDVPLGPLATRALDTLCRRYRVDADLVLRSIVENFLSDACTDDTLAPCMADVARLMKRTGKLPESYWPRTELATPGFEGEGPEDVVNPLLRELFALQQHVSALEAKYEDLLMRTAAKEVGA